MTLSTHSHQALSRGLSRLWRFAFVLSLNPEIADKLVETTCLWASTLPTFPQTSRRQDVILLKQIRLEWEIENLVAARHVGALGEVSGKYNSTIDKFLARILQLPAQQRCAILLAYVEDLSYRETAEVLQTTIVDINHTLLAARMALFTHTSAEL